MGISHPLHRRRVLRELELLQVVRGAELLPDVPKDAEFCPGDVLSHKLHASISSAPSLLSTADLTPRLSLKASSSHCAEPLGSLLEQQNAAGFDPALGQQCGWSHASTRAPSSSSEVLLSSNRSSGCASGTNGKEPLCESEARPHAKEVRFSASPCDPPGLDLLDLSSKNALLSRRCVSLRQQLSLERQRRSIAASESEFRLLRLRRERDALHQELREAHRIRRAHQRDSRMVRERLRSTIANARADKESAKPESAEPAETTGHKGQVGRDQGRAVTSVQ
ncbi:unnamed protein product [Symbiodinium pilosum]|uniref:Uncharacterized protein n=1 Tax=Symbiodinium pilosum TaxID=2952 RepID=A0A812UQ57_SYMPI|nr:unnamed protein product [Symbiodinium pilosum]